MYRGFDVRLLRVLDFLYILLLLSVVTGGTLGNVDFELILYKIMFGD